MEDDFFEVRRIGGLSQSFSHKWENVNPDRDALLVCPSLFSSLFSDFPMLFKNAAYVIRLYGIWRERNIVPQCHVDRQAYA